MSAASNEKTAESKSFYVIPGFLSRLCSVLCQLTLFISNIYRIGFFAIRPSFVPLVFFQLLTQHSFSFWKKHSLVCSRLFTIAAPGHRAWQLKLYEATTC